MVPMVLLIASFSLFFQSLLYQVGEFIEGTGQCLSRSDQTT